MVKINNLEKLSSHRPVKSQSFKMVPNVQNQNSMDHWDNINLQVVGNIGVRGFEGVSSDVKGHSLFLFLHVA